MKTLIILFLFCGCCPISTSTESTSTTDLTTGSTTGSTDSNSETGIPTSSSGESSGKSTESSDFLKEDWSHCIQDDECLSGFCKIIPGTPIHFCTKKCQNMTICVDSVCVDQDFCMKECKDDKECPFDLKCQIFKGSNVCV